MNSQKMPDPPEIAELSEASLEKFCDYLVELKNRGVILVKGHKGGECNRTGCTNQPSFYWNRYTGMWYCEACAKRINECARPQRDICHRIT